MRPSTWLFASVVLAAAVGLAGCTATGAPASTASTGTTTGSQTASGGGAAPVTGGANNLTGTGASFPAVLYTKWFNEYKNATGVQVNYQSIGSGGGIKAISDQTVDFGASDAPLTDAQLAAAKGGALLHVPTALGGVAVTYNIPGVSKQLKFTADTLAGIYLGEIKKWNDPKLVADNPDAALPNADIVVVHRSDGSGTTNIFTDYLSAVSDKWKAAVGVGTSVNWPVGLGGKGNEGVSAEVKQNPNSIGYVEVIYAIQNKLSVGVLKNKAGTYVEPTLDTVTAAAAGIVQTIAPDLRASIVNADGGQSYPISGFTYLLVYEKQTDKAKGIALVNMLWWAIHDGQQYNKDLGYAPLPKEIVSKAEGKIRAITFDGQPLLK